MTEKMKALKQLDEQAQQLVNNFTLIDHVYGKFDKLLRAGAIEPSDLKPSDFTTANNVIYLVLQELSEKFKPLIKTAKEELNNFENF